MLPGKISGLTGSDGSPVYVDVIVNDGTTAQKMSLRDEASIALLLSLVEGGKTVEAKAPPSPKFSVFIPPVGLKSYPYSPSAIWQTADGYAIRRNQTTTLLNGDFADFVEWLKIRRLNQLRRSAQPADRQLAKALLKQNGDAHLDALLRIAKSPNQWFPQAGISAIAELVNE